MVLTVEKLNKIMEEKIQQAFNEVFKGKQIFSMDLKRRDVARWDSLHHVQLMIALENAFNIRFDGADATQINSISDIIKIVTQRIG